MNLSVIDFGRSNQVRVRVVVFQFRVGGYCQLVEVKVFNLGIWLYMVVYVCMLYEVVYGFLWFDVIWFLWGFQNWNCIGKLW